MESAYPQPRFAEPEARTLYILQEKEHRENGWVARPIKYSLDKQKILTAMKEHTQGMPADVSANTEIIEVQLL